MSVNTIITNANTRSDNAIANAQSFIDQLAALANDDTIALSSNWSLSVWDHQLRTDTTIEQPAIAAETALEGRADLTLPEIVDPAAVDYFDERLPSVWSDGAVPSFNEVAPSIDAPSAPTTPAPVAPSAHDVADIPLQDWTTQTLPADPSLTESPLPSPSVLEIAAVDLSVPALNLNVPVNTFEFVENDYSSNLLTALEALLLDDVENGGYGIDPTAEQGIYERARDRESKQAAVSAAQIRRGIASRGFPLPPGSLYAAERATLQEGAAALSALNREIVLKRADLYVQARQFAVQQGLNVEQALMSYVGAKQERALKAQQITAELSIQFHNAGVQLFQLQVELKRLYRDLHSEQLQTAVTKIREYEQQLAHIDAEDKRNQTRLRFHQQLIAAVQLAYQAQQFEDEHTKLALELERLKLQASQDRVNVYATQVRARADEFDAYRTAWQGEEAKQKVFAQQIAAHDAQLAAISKESQLKQDRFEAELKLIEARRQKYATLLQERSETLREEVARLDALSRGNNEEIDIWKTLRSIEQFNISKQLQYQIEHANKVLEADRTNLDRLSKTADAVLGLKQLNGASAQAAIGLYERAIEGAEGSLSAIASLAETA